MLSKVFWIEPHAPCSSRLRNKRTGLVTRWKCNLRLVGDALNALANRGLEVDDVVDAVRGVDDQPEVVRCLNSRRSSNVRLAGRCGQAEEDSVEAAQNSLVVSWSDVR